MTPPKKGVSTNIGKNFSEMLRFEDLAVKFFLSFLLRSYFCEKNLELVSNASFMNVDKKFKNILRKEKNVLGCLKGPPLSPSNTLRLFPVKCFLIFFFLFLTARSSNLSVSAKFFPMLVEMPYFGEVINPKTYLNHELGSKLFS